MENIASWVMQMCICSVAVVIAENLLPQGNVRKSVYFILGLVVLLCFASPLKNIASESFSLQQENMSIQENTAWFNRMTDDTFKKNIKKLIEDCLLKIDVTFEEIEITTDIDEDNCISISSIRITVPDTYKDSIDLISNEVYKNLGLDADVIIGKSG